ncbi:hypothetical protein [uncultured Dokdonia sp.]|uniref:hypothetical protein n=1 Tax=uncultured Dokdonia sp. TaxID=575653 RepID=UPI0026237065|nr:hypothetical protein [uncultured Dokdonia sp.]
MAQDLRKMLKQAKEEHTMQLREGHQSRFEDRLTKALPPQDETHGGSKKGIFFFMKIAAMLLVASGIIWGVAKYAFAKADTEPTFVSTETKELPKEERVLQLSDLSPDFKKVEDYYLASINVELARLEINDENQELIDAFLKQLSALDEEYKRLNKEITESGISEEMVTAMIDNLKLRAELLSKLKRKLTEIKASQEDAIQTI